jgi:hypothetical protein
VEKLEGFRGRETDTCDGDVGSSVGEVSLAVGRMAPAEGRHPWRRDGRRGEEVAVHGCGRGVEENRSESFFLCNRWQGWVITLQLHDLVHI